MEHQAEIEGIQLGIGSWIGLPQSQDCSTADTRLSETETHEHGIFQAKTPTTGYQSFGTIEKIFKKIL